MCSCEHGTCINGFCKCEPRWLGDNCNISTEVEARLPVFIAYHIIFAIAHWALTAYVAWQLTLAIRAHQRQEGTISKAVLGRGRRISTQIICLFVLLSCAIMRAIFYSIDPHCWRGVFIWQVNGLLLDVPVMLLLVAFCVNLIVWMRMQIQFAASTSDFSIRFMSVQPSILKAIIFIFPIIVLVEEILYAVAAISFSVSVIMYNFATALTIIYVIVCVLYFGGKIMSYLKQTQSIISNTKAYTRGLFNMTKMVIGGSIFGGIGAILLIIQLSAGCGNLRIGYCTAVYHTFFRLSEIFIVLLVVSAVSSTLRKDGVESPGGGSGGKVPSTQRKSQNPSHRSNRSQRSQASFVGEEKGQGIIVTATVENQAKEKEIDNNGLETAVAINSDQENNQGTYHPPNENSGLDEGKS